MSGAILRGASQFVALEFWAHPLPFLDHPLVGHWR